MRRTAKWLRVPYLRYYPPETSSRQRWDSTSCGADVCPIDSRQIYATFRPGSAREHIRRFHRLNLGLVGRSGSLEVRFDYDLENSGFGQFISEKWTERIRFPSPAPILNRPILFHQEFAASIFQPWIPEFWIVWLPKNKGGILFAVRA
jgi:hypothetical protein